MLLRKFPQYEAGNVLYIRLLIFAEYDLMIDLFPFADDEGSRP